VTPTPVGLQLKPGGGAGGAIEIDAGGKKEKHEIAKGGCLVFASTCLFVSPSIDLLITKGPWPEDRHQRTAESTIFNWTNALRCRFEGDGWRRIVWHADTSWSLHFEGREPFGRVVVKISGDDDDDDDERTLSLPDTDGDASWGGDSLFFSGWKSD
jgi:hypothetical protein